MRFSERVGTKQPRNEIQLESMDEILKNRLWNCVIKHIWSSKDHVTVTEKSNLFEIIYYIWSEFYKKPTDEIPVYLHEANELIKKRFYECDWDEAYDFIECLASINDEIFDQGDFVEDCNKIFEKEMSGYRFINNQISPITSETEIREISKAIEKSKEYELRGVHIHLDEALKKFSDRKKQDCRNSIKESISAVESICKVISENENATLGDAIKIVESKTGIHKALKAGFSNLYGYTSSEDGIRHALTEDPSSDFDDAKYMLVSCSAFVNYLIGKCVKSGIKLN